MRIIVKDKLKNTQLRYEASHYLFPSAEHFP